MTSSVSKLRVRRFLLLTAGLLLLALTPAASSAGPIGWNLAGGRYDKLSGTDQPYFVSVGPRLGFGSVMLVPNAEWLFVEGADVYTLNVDAAMVLVPAGVASAWVGGGVGFRTVKPDGLEASTDRTTNVFAGAGMNLVPMKPFAQIKWVVEDEQKPVALSVGIRF